MLFVWLCGSRENRRNATWEGHILTRKCCVPNGSKKYFPLPPLPQWGKVSPSRLIYNATRYHSRIYSAFFPILLASFLLLWKSSSIGRECFVLFHSRVEWEENTSSLSLWKTYMGTNIKFSVVHNDREREKNSSDICQASSHIIVGCFEEKMF